ncbi:MAG TPA: signal recognition particle protein Srp19 [Thermococcus sp.]|nr:MAG: signal recognition particle protein Srp19 [Archaeoglobales archaeon ex4484_92]RLF76944.1 MAG: signal recognition particle protein Srp19 [Thermococci archaeon]RLF81189.1 MAG: signal recognition particle protein Srp19 [Thermococci archaeon]RLF83398.1 MAG: signal recognition particle protein Srp19 [Thermococci archaeon]HDH45415.1 signal recognition particle protein Srp19 [Thermococcus sp.]
MFKVKRFVIWVNEIDARIPRKYGREVPKNLAVDRPSLGEILEAAQALRLNIINIDREALNPRVSALNENLRIKGRIVVESSHGKSKTLKLITQKVREFRKLHRKK